MSWYTGPTLLEYLETVPLQISDPQSEPLRFPVQLVARPGADFRGFAGRVERGELRVGQAVRALPSGRTTRVSSIVTYDGDLKAAHSPQSVTVTLEDEIDLSRGEMLVDAGTPPPSSSTALRANIVWMDEQLLAEGQTLLLKHTTRMVRATVRAIRHRVDVVTTQPHEATQLQMNDIAEVELQTNLPLFFDPYEVNRPLGSFILIDSISNATVAAGMILSSAEESREFEGLFQPAFIWLRGSQSLAQVQHDLADKGKRSVIIDDPAIPEQAIPAVARALQLAGVFAISARDHLQPTTISAIRDLVGAGWIEGDADLQRFLEEDK